jgi:hypothetical protein
MSLFPALLFPQRKKLSNTHAALEAWHPKTSFFCFLPPNALDGPVRSRFLHLYTAPTIMCGVFAAFLCTFALFERMGKGG